MRLLQSVMKVSELFLGVDGGGTKTLALISDSDGNILGRGVSGPSNYHRVGAQAAYLALEMAVEHALNSLDPTIIQAEIKNIKAVCLGLAGVDRPVDRQIIEKWINKRFPNIPNILTNDALPVLAAGTPLGWGLAIISGTGSIAYSLSPGGDLHRAGGWGYIFGDEGSAYSIGLAALRAAAQSADGRLPQTDILPAILTKWELTEPPDLVNKVYRTDIGRENIAELAILVNQIALTGDKIAVDILRNAGLELAKIGFAATKHFDLTRPVPTALAGSVLLKNPIIVNTFIQSLTEFGIKPVPVTNVPEPAIGCIKLALQLRNN